MKKWGKILVWIGIIWIIILIAGLVIFYFNLAEWAKIAQEGTPSLQPANFALLQIFEPNFISFLTYFLIIGTPSWILLIISAIWGREENITS